MRLTIALALVSLWLAAPLALRAEDASIDLRSVDEAMELARAHLAAQAREHPPVEPARRARAKPAARPVRAVARPLAAPLPWTDDDAADRTAALARLQQEELAGSGEHLPPVVRPATH